MSSDQIVFQFGKGHIGRFNGVQERRIQRGLTHPHLFHRLTVIELLGHVGVQFVGHLTTGLVDHLDHTLDRQHLILQLHAPVYYRWVTQGLVDTTADERLFFKRLNRCC